MPPAERSRWLKKKSGIRIHNQWFTVQYANNKTNYDENGKVKMEITPSDSCE